MPIYSDIKTCQNIQTLRHANIVFSFEFVLARLNPDCDGRKKKCLWCVFCVLIKCHYSDLNIDAFLCIYAHT